jgi:hypothetical protein
MTTATNKKVTINGINGTVTVDHEDGTFTVCMDDNTTYFATSEELGLITETETKEQPKTSNTKINKIFKAVESGMNFRVRVPSTKGNVIKTCFIKEFKNEEGRYRNSNYFLVEEDCQRVGKTYWVHISRIVSENGHSFSFNNQYYKEQVLGLMKEYA